MTMKEIRQPGMIYEWIRVEWRERDDPDLYLSLRKFGPFHTVMNSGEIHATP